ASRIWKPKPRCRFSHMRCVHAALRPGHTRVVPLLLARPCNPVNYRAGTVAPCKQKEKNRPPVKGEIYRRAFVIYLNGLTKSESRRIPNRHITGARTGGFSASTNVKEAVVAVRLALRDHALHPQPDVTLALFLLVPPDD